MNCMREVANMLNVKIGEEFEVPTESAIFDRYKFKIENDGFYIFSPFDKEWIKNSNIINRLLNGEIEIIKSPILTDIEKSYLSSFIKYRNLSVIYIVKYHFNCSIDGLVIRTKSGDVDFEQFKPGSSFKGMELTKHYTLEELGL